MLLPPLNEQRRIVEKLERLLSSVEASQKRLEKILLLLKRFRQSVLAAACSGRLTEDWRETNSVVESAYDLLKRIDTERRKQFESDIKKAKTDGKILKKPNYLNYAIGECKVEHDIPTSWINAPIGLLCDCIVPGRDKPKSFTGSIPWITLPDISSIEIEDCLSGLKLSEAEIEEVNARIIPPESVIMSCIGRFGISAVVKRPVVVNQQLHAFLKSKAILPKYLAFHIQVLDGYMHEISTSTTISYLNKDNCNSLPINLPPLTEQQEIVRRVEALFKLADEIEARYQKARAYVDRLTQSILARAFRGELVPQDPSDEPASALLERIRQQRAANENTNNKARRVSRKKKQASLFGDES